VNARTLVAVRRATGWKDDTLLAIFSAIERTDEMKALRADAAKWRGLTDYQQADIEAARAGK
jgi:hypothetical protein